MGEEITLMFFKKIQFGIICLYQGLKSLSATEFIWLGIKLAFMGVDNV